MSSRECITPEQLFLQELKISLRQGRRIIARGEIRVIRIGRLVRIPVSEAERFIAERFSAPKPEAGCRRAPFTGGVANIVDEIVGQHRRRV